MTLRIERVQRGIRLSGEFRVGQLDQVKTEIERCESPVVLDLEELELIDLEGVRFLNACESAGLRILHCTARLTTGNGCCRREVRRKSIQNRGNRPYVARNEGRLTRADAP